MKVDISKGELIDKITILEIKMDRIKDENKLKNVKTELDILSTPIVHGILPWNLNLRSVFLD